MRFGFRTLAAGIAVSFLAVPVVAHHAIEDQSRPDPDRDAHRHGVQS